MRISNIQNGRMGLQADRQGLEAFALGLMDSSTPSMTKVYNRGKQEEQ